MHKTLWMLAITLSNPVAAGAQTDQSAHCRSLLTAVIDRGRVTGAAVVAASPASAEHPDWPIAPVPAHCRVTFELTPSAQSLIRAELWLPTANWNGRFLGVGVGGYAGVINTGDLQIAIQRGYAAAATDTGHGTEGTEIWARGQREKVIDFGDRAIHLTTVAAKALTAGIYGRPSHHAYFSGCSNGGRQALMEASRHPQDYDGIIAGAPAADLVGLFVAAFGANHQALAKNPFPAAKLPALRRAVLAQCDALDGSVDGLISAPQACHFNPAAMRCNDKETDQCLSAGQIESLDAIYHGAHSRDGQSLYPGFSVGGEDKEPPSPGWEGWLVPAPARPTEQFNFFNTFMRDFVTGDPKWTPAGFDLERDLAAARRSMSPLLDANSPDLQAYAARGGKLILWHGWSDQAIPPLATIRYYDAVRAMMGAARSDAFTRLYMAPGMQHCWLGPGPWSFNPLAAKQDADPHSDMAAALEAWVEKGDAPGAITAIRPKNAYSILAGFPPLEVARSGLLCPYPSVAVYDHKGSSLSAASYACAGVD